MEVLQSQEVARRYQQVSDVKAGGATYTPKILADFVAGQMVQAIDVFQKNRPLRILDPALGHGELVLSLLESITTQSKVAKDIHVFGFETDSDALDIATTRIENSFPQVTLRLEHGNFLDFVMERPGTTSSKGNIPSQSFDLIIANPPYVRTQIMGAEYAQLLSQHFGLTGRVDLYHAFILAMAQVLDKKGVAGIITSNRFMTTRSGIGVRQAILDQFNVRHVWDLGDTKLFEAAILPAILLVAGAETRKIEVPGFTSIYQVSEDAEISVTNPINALSREGLVSTEDGCSYEVRHGTLDTGGSADGIWRIATKNVSSWLETVEAHTWGTFRDIGKIRVGVKTCADKVFIRSDWDCVRGFSRPELLLPLMTHHMAQQFKSAMPAQQLHILYPHEMYNGRRRAVDLEKFPHSKAYLEAHRSTLEGRKYVIEGGREWYEIWVPHNPEAWKNPKLVFRDISEKPTFWLDLEGFVVNGDCYWLSCQDQSQIDLLWLALAVANSTFIEQFYDYRFNNKLYAGRRRFMTQYVEKFPLPDPKSDLAEEIVTITKEIYDLDHFQTDTIQERLDALIWRAFGVD